jgi:hypothetical protein
MQETGGRNWEPRRGGSIVALCVSAGKLEPHKANIPTPTLPFAKREGEEFVRLGGFFGFFMLAPDFSRVIQNINHKSPTVSTVCGDAEKTE